MSKRTGLAVLVPVLLVASCSVGQVSTQASKPRPASPQPSHPAPPPTALAAIQACDLLTAEEVASLDMRPPGRAEQVLGLRRCDWTTPEGNGVSTGINENPGMERLILADTSSITDLTIGRHRAKHAQDSRKPGYCEIVFAVGDTANVSVLALFPNDTTRACAVTDRAAALVEPRLP
jgi:hypothetical protein